MSEDQLIGYSNSSGHDLGNDDSTRIHSNLVFSGPVFVVLVVMMVTLAVVIVLGNALVIYAFKVDKSLRRQCNYYFLNLAISDFLVGAFCIPLYMPYVLTGRWPLGRALCKLWLVMDYLLCSASVFNIVLISYDRFLSVTRAVSYRASQGLPQLAITRMLCVWLLAFALYGPAIIFWELAVGGSRVPSDQCFAEFYSTWYFLLSASTLEFFSPLLSGKSDNPPSLRPHPPHHGAPPGERLPDPSAAPRASRLSRDKKIAKSLAVIVCVFAICWAPYTLLMIIRAACRGRCIPHHWYEVTFWLLWLNSAINPFLYPLCHSSFRRAFARILCPRSRGTPCWE
ncbi:hypothetical protein NHX12_004963 [Muraenolepis orangiensis]|uniref:G-protein coupled receptors family 1 profile domain-containing protein n=1 Tax=Muraenolepis orangiensis TaxID=630683 RepID=A0A9Q0IEU4_9TELE|nr:hypothetical protein NHX12_004963 [Muraenolepis orangiensis]